MTTPPTILVFDSGLGGLTVLREIVRAHGGEIQVRSNPGEGSVFSFSLPIASKEKIA